MKTPEGDFLLADEVGGQDVTALTLDSAVSIRIGDERQFQLRIEQEFSLHREGQTTRVAFYVDRDKNGELYFVTVLTGMAG